MIKQIRIGRQDHRRCGLRRVGLHARYIADRAEDEPNSTRSVDSAPRAAGDVDSVAVPCRPRRLGRRTTSSCTSTAMWERRADDTPNPRHHSGQQPLFMQTDWGKNDWQGTPVDVLVL